jgi:hypothetical protein
MLSVELNAQRATLNAQRSSWSDDDAFIIRPTLNAQRSTLKLVSKVTH